MNRRTLTLALVSAFLFLTIAGTSLTHVRHATALDTRTSITSAEQHTPIDALQDAADDNHDQRMHVLLYTLLAAGGAAGVGLVLFLLRIAMGWTKPPPPPAEEAHH